MINGGWAKLHRKLLESETFASANLLKVWIWCLLRAAHSPRKVVVGRQEVLLKAGQFITGRQSMAEELSMKPTTAWSQMVRLQEIESVDIKSNNKFSVITVENWAFYQQIKEVDDSYSDSKMTATPTQTRILKNIKNPYVYPMLVEHCPDDDFLEAMADYFDMRTKVKAPPTERAVQLLLGQLNTWHPGDFASQIKIINQSTSNSWRGLFPLRENGTVGSKAGNGDYSKPKKGAKKQKWETEGDPTPGLTDEEILERMKRAASGQGKKPKDKEETMW